MPAVGRQLYPAGLKAAEPAAMLEVLAPPLLLPATREATREAAATWPKAPVFGWKAAVVDGKAPVLE